MMPKSEVDSTLFQQLDLRVGTIVAASLFPEAKRPAIKLTIDFGEIIGKKQSSAQITAHYQPESLIGKQVMAVVNFPPKQIGHFISQVLVLGAIDDHDEVVLLSPDHPVANGSQIL